MKADGGKKGTRINLSVILLGALHNISHNPKIQATALDFELLRSIGKQTFEKIRPFFCDVVEGELN